MTLSDGQREAHGQHLHLSGERSQILLTPPASGKEKSGNLQSNRQRKCKGDLKSEEI